MKWRIIVRISFDGDTGSKLRYAFEKCMGKCGVKFDRKTRTWEGAAVSPQEATDQLRAVFEILSDPKSIGIRRACLDNMLVTIDRINNQ